MKNNEKVCVWDDNDGVIVFDGCEAAEKAGFSFEDMIPLVEVLDAWQAGKPFPHKGLG